MSTETMKAQSRGKLPGIIRNDDDLYEGDLTHYFQVLFYFAGNLRLPYHNFRHMCHVLYLCYEACSFYRDTLTKREMRNLLIAALFHDFDHSGMMGNDDLNIERAIRGLRARVIDEDTTHLEDIILLIRSTEYPYVIKAEDLYLGGLILRDADVSQSLSVAWIQQVVFGLATEWNMSPLEVLKKQEPFLSNLAFHTEWARQEFPLAEIKAKITESSELLEILKVD